ncbi:MAG: hypothetical protein JWP85_998 [Rhodoglobus sp.]|nr:hypothetical protein [Rhodoglobus sp.]
MTDDRASLGKVYDAIQAVQLDIAVIKTALPDITDHEARIRSLERRQWMIAGALVLLTTGSTYLQLIFRS